MKMHEFKATDLMAETFKKRGVKFDVVNSHGTERLLAGFPIDCGPSVIMQFISRDDDNDVAARIFGLVSNTPNNKRSRIMEACNVLNNKIRFMKFYLDSDGDINVEYDFPVSSPDEGIGEMAFEIFVRTMQILNSEYSIFMKALYSDEELDSQNQSLPPELMRKLQELRQLMERQRTTVNHSAFDEEDGPELKNETDNSSDFAAC